MTDITELALIKGQRVEAPYYLAECTECGKMYSSSKLIESRNYFDGDEDCYCPHCNADDADIADLGSGEQPAVMAWNYQQARIDALVEALEKAQQVDEELCKLLPPGAEYMDPPDGGDVTPLEGVRRMVADYRQRIAEMESRTVTVKLTDINEYLAEVHDKTLNRAFRLLAEGVRAGDVAAMRAAGIKVEAELWH
ncbi:hypothetical protein AAHZ44_19220 [Klebsiella pneumoniae]|uniref:hypothetical protein n=1 Tax=Klebsiella pneumoniae TaxID=573 RepID=UPI00330E0DE8|nr:hypothetical protein [Klebsiella pneumoniae]HDH0322766.1 hypothetical protein [Klebsiella pneumoniae]HDH0425068.1 hypothetical protein [Klebsiella pneumoniae]HDH1119729.1 hypothetical protein [Klebsiella pneumoniae]